MLGKRILVAVFLVVFLVNSSGAVTATVVPDANQHTSRLDEFNIENHNQYKVFRTGSLFSGVASIIGGDEKAPDWWSAVQDGLLKSEYYITWQEQTYLADIPASYQAPNRAQNLRTYFTSQGPVIIPRTWSEDQDLPPWRWEVSMVGLGREQNSEPVHSTEIGVEESRLNYLRVTADQLFVESYSNSPAGIQQTFTIPSTPEIEATNLPLVLSLRLGGDLTPYVVNDGVAIDFHSPENQVVLRYAEFESVDANGERLPVWLSLDGGIISLFVDDSGASYPIQISLQIDGLAVEPEWAVGLGQAGDHFGMRVATAGDVNGDGYSDVIVGSPHYDGGKVDEGRADVYLGWVLGLSVVSSWHKESNQAEAHYGWAVATAGDVNGDGYADIIVGAPEFDNGQVDEGGAWIYHGSEDGPSLAPNNFDEGNMADARFGASVATAGDVNGDGYADVIVSAPLYNNGQTEEGRVFVWHGSDDGISELHDWHAEINKAEALFGSSVSTAGDVNGDGFADIIIGANRYTASNPEQGAAFVWHGSANGVNNGIDGDQTNYFWRDYPDVGYARFGYSVSTAGDVNGDGYADVIVGAPFYTNGQGSEGGAWLYLGSGSGLEEDPDNKDEGNQTNANLGRSVATAGDVNGDGYADVIVGAPGYSGGQNNEGRVWVWHGSPDGISTTYDWDAEGNLEDAQFGWSVATAGDVDGDGYSDVIIGSPMEVDPEGVGMAYVYHGSADSLEDVASWTKTSNLEDALYGFSVASAGDVNGDGYADVIVGAPQWDGGKVGEGAAWVYLGQANGLSSAPDWYKRSNKEDAWFGHSVGSAGDVNGDGYDDVIVGAPYWYSSKTNEGAAFVYHGSSSGVNDAPGWSKVSNQEGALYGYSVGTAGDINGDGYGDIVVGAPLWDGGDEDEGAVWIYQGSASGLSSAPDWYKQVDHAGAQFGFSVSTAGDVNRDGFSDVIIGSPYWEDNYNNEGRAWVYLGSKFGMQDTDQWHAESNQAGARLGFSVATAGDVDRDGFSDVIVGAPNFGDGGLENEGKVWLFPGSASGVEPSATWSRESGQDGALYGFSVATAGDVNGDGYADVVLGAPLMNHDLTSEGSARVYLGSSSGLNTAYHWKGEGNQTLSWYGASVGTAGDVNGDGYADVIIGAHEFNGSKTNEGKALVYYGNGGPGVALAPHQMQYTAEPLAHLGRTDPNFFWRYMVSMQAKTPFGRGGVALQVEPKQLGVPYNSRGTYMESYYTNDPHGQPHFQIASGLETGALYRWRARLLYNPATTPWMPASRWVTIPWNGGSELDFRTYGSRSYLPLLIKYP